MKKLLVLLLVLGMASVSQAASVGFQIGGAKEYVATPGETITVDVIADVKCTAFELGAVGETLSVNASRQTTSVTAMGGWIAGTVGTNTATTAPTGTLSAPGWVNNYNGLLFDLTAWYGDVAAGEVIASFTYTIGSLETDYWVAPLVSGTSYEWQESSFDTAGSSYGTLLASVPENIAITGVHIIPEPMTIALLGLGGLFLRRRRK